MRIIELDAQNWKSFSDYFNALRAALGSPPGHGNSVDAFIDSMVWGGMNKVEPPYTVRIKNTHALPREILEEIELLRQTIPEARAESIASQGYDVDVSLEIVPLKN